MNFATYNRPWIEEMQAQKAYISRSGALDQLKSFQTELRAFKDPLLPIPLSFDRHTFETLAAAGSLVISAQTKILRHLQRQCSRTELLGRFGIPESMESVVNWDELVADTHVVSRFDVVPSNDGYYFCEFNRDSSVGGVEVADCVQVLCNALGWPLTEGMASPQHATVGLLRRVVEQKGLSRIVLCDWSTNRGNGHFSYDLLRQHLVRALPELEIHLLYETEYRDAWFDPQEGRRTLAFRGFMYEDMTDGGAFVRRLCDSGATIINTFETEMRMHKACFAMFCDPAYRHLLNAAEIEAIERYVPHSVIVGRDNLEDLLRRKAELVFKLGASYGGHDVLMGGDHPADKLRALLEAKGVERWIAQQVITFDGLDVPFASDLEFNRHNIVLGLYVIDGRASGMSVRASSRSKVVNVVSGAGGYAWAVPMTPEEQARHLEAMRRARTQP